VYSTDGATIAKCSGPSAGVVAATFSSPFGAARAVAPSFQTPGAFFAVASQSSGVLDLVFGSGTTWAAWGALPPLSSFALHVHPAPGGPVVIGASLYVVDKGSVRASLVPVAGVRAELATVDSAGALVVPAQNGIASFDGAWSVAPLFDPAPLHGFATSADGSRWLVVTDHLAEIDTVSSASTAIETDTAGGAILAPAQIFAQGDERVLAAASGIYRRAGAGAWTKIASANIGSATGFGMDGAAMYVADLAGLRSVNADGSSGGQIVGEEGRIVADPRSPGALYYATTFGCALWKKAAGATTWDHVADVCGVLALRFAADDTVAFAASNSALQRVDLATGAPTPCGALQLPSNAQVLVDPSDADHLFVVGADAAFESFSGCR
jgi:hypothetical protein